MAKEYIERDSLIELANNRVDGVIDANDIAMFPTADVVEVVRCKDCKHFDMKKMECQNEEVSTDHEGGASYSLNFYLDDFCSYGERRDDNAAD